MQQFSRMAATVIAALIVASVVLGFAALIKMLLGYLA